MAYYPDKTILISLLYWMSNCPGNMPKYYQVICQNIYQILLQKLTRSIIIANNNEIPSIIRHNLTHKQINIHTNNIVVYVNVVSFGHGVVCSSSIYGFWYFCIFKLFLCQYMSMYAYHVNNGDGNLKCIICAWSFCLVYDK